MLLTKVCYIIIFSSEDEKGHINVKIQNCHLYRFFSSHIVCQCMRLLESIVGTIGVVHE